MSEKTSGAQALVLAFLIGAGFPVLEAVRLIHDGMSLDDARELAFVAEHLEVLGVGL